MQRRSGGNDVADGDKLLPDSDVTVIWMTSYGELLSWFRHG